MLLGDAICEMTHTAWPLFKRVGEIWESDPLMAPMHYGYGKTFMIRMTSKMNIMTKSLLDS